MCQVDEEQVYGVVRQVVDHWIDDHSRCENGHTNTIRQIEVTLWSGLPLWTYHCFDRIMVQATVARFKFPFIRGDNFIWHRERRKFLLNVNQWMQITIGPPVDLLTQVCVLFLCMLKEKQIKNCKQFYFIFKLQFLLHRLWSRRTSNSLWMNCCWNE